MTKDPETTNPSMEQEDRDQTSQNDRKVPWWPCVCLPLVLDIKYFECLGYLGAKVFEHISIEDTGISIPLPNNQGVRNHRLSWQP